METSRSSFGPFYQPSDRTCSACGGVGSRSVPSLSAVPRRLPRWGSIHEKKIHLLSTELQSFGGLNELNLSIVAIPLLVLFPIIPTYIKNIGAVPLIIIVPTSTLLITAYKNPTESPGSRAIPKPIFIFIAGLRHSRHLRTPLRVCPFPEVCSSLWCP